MNRKARLAVLALAVSVLPAMVSSPQVINESAVYGLMADSLLSPPAPDSDAVLELQHFLDQLSKGGHSWTVPGVTIVNKSSSVVPPGAATLVKVLAEEVVGPFFADWPNEDQPILIIVLPYETYVESCREIQGRLRRIAPWFTAPATAVADSTGIFVPVAQLNQQVILTYQWDWWTLAHELVHHAIMRQWNVVAAVHHAVVHSATAWVWKTPQWRSFLAQATRGP
jgi:hypothetical protein